MQLKIYEWNGKSIHHGGYKQEYQKFCNYFIDWIAEKVAATGTSETVENRHNSTLETLETRGKIIVATRVVYSNDIFEAYQIFRCTNVHTNISSGAQKTMYQDF